MSYNDFCVSWKKWSSYNHYCRKLVNRGPKCLKKKKLIKPSISLLILLKLDLFKFKQIKSNSTLTNNLYQDFVFRFNA